MRTRGGVGGGGSKEGGKGRKGCENSKKETLTDGRVRGCGENKKWSKRPIFRNLMNLHNNEAGRRVNRF